MPNKIPPEYLALLEELTQGGLAEDEQALLEEQYKQAQKMRSTPMPAMRTYGDGHVVAPNAMEVAAAAIDRYRGGQGMRDMMDQRYANLAKTQAGVKAQLMAQLLREFAPQPEAPPIPSSQYADAAPMSPDPTALANPFPVPWETSGPVGTPPAGRPRAAATPPEARQGPALMVSHRPSQVPPGATRFANTPALYKIVFGE